MSLSKRREKELVRLVKSRYPSFELEGILDYEESGQVRVPHENPDEEDYVITFTQDDFQPIASCCGVYELSGLELAHMNKSDIALFTLWINAYYLPACIIATTATSKEKEVLTTEEKILKGVGFIPVHRGLNRNSGNQVTLWVFRVSKDTRSSVIQPKEKKVASTKLPNSTRSRAK